jgi:hypothetical protein
VKPCQLEAACFCEFQSGLRAQAGVFWSAMNGMSEAACGKIGIGAVRTLPFSKWCTAVLWGGPRIELR